jgi:hypothetical protein
MHSNHSNCNRWNVPGVTWNASIVICNDFSVSTIQVRIKGIGMCSL